MVERSRKHGPFDGRYPARRKLSPPDWELAPDEQREQRLGWAAFAARFFPDRRRHDFEALAAYEAYRNRLDEAPPTPEAALSVWEWDGGALGRAGGGFAATLAVGTDPVLVADASN